MKKNHTRKYVSNIMTIFFWLGVVACATLNGCSTEDEYPNIVLIFVDDMGYADLGSYGAVGYETPHLDKMAKEGMRFTDFHSSTAVCSASRASLLTGCYSERVSIRGALGPSSPIGLNPNEENIAEILKQKGLEI